jgi:hypothetical protein
VALDNNHVIVVVDVGPYPGDVPAMLNKGPESERKLMLPVWSMPKVESSDWYRSIEQGVTERQQLPTARPPCKEPCVPCGTAAFGQGCSGQGCPWISVSTGIVGEKEASRGFDVAVSTHTHPPTHDETGWSWGVQRAFVFCSAAGPAG